MRTWKPSSVSIVPHSWWWRYARGSFQPTIKLDAEIDATDQLEFPDQNKTVAKLGLHAHLAALETIVYPTTNQILANQRLAQSGTLEIFSSR